MIRLLLLERLSQVYFNKVAILCGLSIVKIWLLRRSLIDKLNDLDNELTQLNQLMTDVINKYSQYAESAWKRGLLDLVTTVKGLFIFFIEIWLGTYACLIGHLIEGTVDFSLDISESVVSKVNSTVFTVADALDTGVSGLLSFIDLLVLLFTGRDKSATYLSSISEGANSLRLLTTNISEEALNGIESIKSKVPDFTKLHNTTESLLGAPFDKLTSKLNGTNSTLSNAPSSLLTSSTNQHSQSVRKLVTLIKSTTSTVMVLFAIAMVISILCYSFMEWIKYRTTTTTTLPVSHLRGLQIWSYMSTSYCNYIFLSSMITFATYLAETMVLNKLGADISISSSAIANSANAVISEYENTINSDWLSKVNTTATDIKHSVNGIVGTLNSTLIHPFKDTPFETPMSTVIYCVIGRKIEKMELGLNWIIHNTQLKLPQYDNKDNTVQSRWSTVIGQHKESLKLELYIAIGLISLWALQLPIGLISSIWKRKTPLPIRTTSLVIGSPKPLTDEEKAAYQYPITRYNIYPYENSSSRYSK